MLGDKLILDTKKYVLENDELKKCWILVNIWKKIAVKLGNAIICSKYDDNDKSESQRL